MTYDECLDRLNREQAKLLTIKEDFTRAKASGRQGQFMPPDEYAALERRVRAQGQLCQRLQVECSRLRRQRSAQFGDAIAKQFVSVCRRRLTPELFNELMAEAKGVEAVSA